MFSTVKGQAQQFDLQGVAVEESAGAHEVHQTLAVRATTQ
jgi:hypothetical protein